MAVTINEYIGFETGGIADESSATSGTPIVTDADIVRSGSYALGMNATADQYDIDPLRHIASAGTGYVFGFAFRATDHTPASATTMVIIGDSTDANVLELALQTDGTIDLIDNTGTTALTDVLEDDTWHYIEIFWNHVDSGTWQVFIDTVSVGTASTRDMSGGGTLDLFRLQGTATGTFYFDDVYILSDAVVGDRLGDCEVFKYQSAKASAVPDDDFPASGSAGDTLNLGTWDQAGITPMEDAGVAAEYTDAGAGAVYSDGTNGSPEGPANDPRIDGDSNIRAIKAVVNMKRSGGGGSDHFILLGNSGGVSGDIIRSGDLGPSQSFVFYYLISESSTVVPTSSEYCAIGFETTGAQDFECQEMWAMLLHVPTVPTLSTLSAADFPKQNYYVGPFEI